MSDREELRCADTTTRYCYFTCCSSAITELFYSCHSYESQSPHEVVHMSHLYPRYRKVVASFVILLFAVLCSLQWTVDSQPQSHTQRDEPLIVTPNELCPATKQEFERL